MFEGGSKFDLVQKRKNRYPVFESYLSQTVFRFYCKNKKCSIKYIVLVKQYPDNLFTLDYYPKISLTPKLNTLNSVQDMRFQMLTKQNSFGRIGGYILDIMEFVQNSEQVDAWGFLAANLPHEISNVENKRFLVYTEILRRTYLQKYKIFGSAMESAIFVIEKHKVSEKELIVKKYEQIFSETN